jgi:Flp pilus assembly pilin Flp
MTRRTGASGESGQTFTETAMILGLIAAIIISLTTIVVPAFRVVVARAVTHMVVYVGTY